jgi:hypothetical protein
MCGIASYTVPEDTASQVGTIGGEASGASTLDGRSFRVGDWKFRGEQLVILRARVRELEGQVAELEARPAVHGAPADASEFTDMSREDTREEESGENLHAAYKTVAAGLASPRGDTANIIPATKLKVDSLASAHIKALETRNLRRVKELQDTAEEVRTHASCTTARWT